MHGFYKVRKGKKHNIHISFNSKWYCGISRLEYIEIYNKYTKSEYPDLDYSDVSLLKKKVCHISKFVKIKQHQKNCSSFLGDDSNAEIF